MRGDVYVKRCSSQSSGQIPVKESTGECVDVARGQGKAVRICKIHFRKIHTKIPAPLDKGGFRYRLRSKRINWYIAQQGSDCIECSLGLFLHKQACSRRRLRFAQLLQCRRLKNGVIGELSPLKRLLLFIICTAAASACYSKKCVKFFYIMLYQILSFSILRMTASRGTCSPSP